MTHPVNVWFSVKHFFFVGEAMNVLVGVEPVFHKAEEDEREHGEGDYLIMVFIS